MDRKVEYLFDDRELEDLDNNEIKFDEKFENEIVNKYLLSTNKRINNTKENYVLNFLNNCNSDRKKLFFTYKINFY